jgi:flagellar biogenesis protein FliO
MSNQDYEENRHLVKESNWMFIIALVVFGAMFAVAISKGMFAQIRFPQTPEDWFIFIISLLVGFAMYPALIFFKPSKEEQNAPGAIYMMWFAMNLKTKIVLMVMMTMMYTFMASHVNTSSPYAIFIIVLIFVVIWAFNKFIWIIKTDDNAGILVTEKELIGRYKRLQVEAVNEVAKLIEKITGSISELPASQTYEVFIEDEPDNETRVTLSLTHRDKLSRGEKIFPKIGSIVIGSNKPKVYRQNNNQQNNNQNNNGNRQQQGNPFRRNGS